MTPHPAPAAPIRAGRGRWSTATIALALLAVVVGLSGCRLDLDTRVEVEASGAGTMALTFRLDGELAEALTATGFDPVPAPVADWEVTRTDAEDGGLEVVVATAFADPAQLQDRVAALREGLDDEDPVIVESIDLRVADDGATDVDARVGVILPSSTGAVGGGLFDGDQLAMLAADPEAFAATFTVVLPGPVQSADADRVDGQVAVWELPLDELVDATASAGPPSPLGTWVVPAIGVGLLLVVVVVGVLVLRRRRRDRRTAPHGRVERLQRF